MMVSNFLFGITRPTNITFVHPSSKSAASSWLGRAVEVAEVGNDRQHAGARESERLELLAVVFGVAEREVRSGRCTPSARAVRGSTA